MIYKEFGVIESKVPEKTHKEEQIEWRIPIFSTLAQTIDTHVRYDSPAFFINGVSWFLELFPKSLLDMEFMRLYIVTKVKREYSVEYSFSLKKSDGSAQQLATGILEGNDTTGDVGNLIKKSEILQRKSELLSKNTLTLICRLKYEIIHSTESTASDKTASEKLIRLDTLSENFKNLFVDKGTCDTTLILKDKEYKAHKSILIARWSVFADIFKHDTLERQTGVITITDCDPDTFALFLEYLYCGKLEEMSVCTALNLYYTPYKYDVQELKRYCIEYLMKHLTVENICEIVVFADKYDETALLSAVQDFFNKNASKVFVTSEWECLMRKDSGLAKKLLIEMSKVKLKD